MNYDRRSFLRNVCAAGLLTPSLLLAAEDAARAEMTLGFGTYGKKSLSTVDVLKLIGETGFDSVELTIWTGWDSDPAALNSHQRLQIKSELDRSNLKLTSLMENLNIDQSPEKRAWRLERIRLAAGLAHELCPESPPLMQTTLGGRASWEMERDMYLDELGAWVDVANQNDLTIAIKPHRGATLSLPGEAVDAIQELGNPQRLKLCYDYGHYMFRDMSIEKSIRDSAGKIAHVAVKDTVQTASGIDYLLPGEGGSIDYPSLLKQLTAAGYRGDICCEVSSRIWKQPVYIPAQAIRTCYLNMSTAFEQAGISRPQTSN